MTSARAAALAAVLGSALLAAEAVAAEESHDWLTIASRLRPERIPELPPLDEQRVRQIERDGFGFTELLMHSELEIRAGGRVSQRETFARRYLSDHGIRTAGNVVIRTHTSHESTEIEAAYVVRANGEVREVAKSEIQVTRGETPNAFSDVYDVVVPFGGLEPGATGVVVFTQREFTPDWPLGWSQLRVYNPYVSAERIETEISWDEGVREPRVEADFDLSSCSRSARRLSCRWHSREVKAIEAQGPSAWDLGAQLVVSQSPSWAELVGEFSAIVEPAVDGDRELRELAARLVGEATTLEERVGRLQRFVADEIRYVAFEHGTGAVVPRPATTTLDRRYGDCKDKVVLFLALARSLGFDAYPVLTSTARFEPARLAAPSWLYFDHMIACVRGASRICVDLTSAETPNDVLPPWLAGAVALEIRDGVTGPSTLDAPEYLVEIEVDTSNEVRCDGSVRERSVRSFTGRNQAQLRLGLRELTHDSRRVWAENEFREVVGSSLRPEARLAGIEDAREPLEITLEVTYPGNGPIASFQAFTDYDPWLNAYAQLLRANNRELPYRMPGMRVRSRIAYRMCPASQVVGYGPDLDFRDAFGSLVRSYALEDGVLNVETELSLPRRQLGAGELERFNRLLAVVGEQTRIWLGLRPGGEGG